jgi:negative regulator of sigma E activity
VTAREVNAGDGGWAGLGLSPRDADLLADYLGGALADTPAEADVARLIREDPAWHRAHAVLAEATAAVTADLTGWGERPEPMPDDIAARLTAALTAKVTAPVTAEEDSDAEPGDAAGSRRGHLSLVPETAGDGGAPARRARPRPPWARWAGPLAAAAAVIAVVGFGLQALPDLNAGSDDAASTAGGAAPEVYAGSGEAAPAAPDAAQAPQAGADRSRRLLATGTDYRRATVTSLRFDATDADGPQPVQPGEATKTTPGSRVSAFSHADLAAQVTPALRRLAAPAALDDCLRAIAAAHGRSLGSGPLIDYARFDGLPALVVAFTDAAGEQWIWVAGPDCGLATAAASTRYRAKVG